jgi:hypothetical protein
MSKGCIKLASNCFSDLPKVKKLLNIEQFFSPEILFECKLKIMVEFGCALGIVRNASLNE